MGAAVTKATWKRKIKSISEWAIFVKTKTPELYNNNTRRFRCPSVEVLMLFAAQMAKAGISPDQIKTRLSHIGNWYLTQTGRDPRYNRYSNAMHWKLATQLRGITKTYSKARKLKIPLTPEKLRKIILALHNNNRTHNADTFTAALTLAVYGLLRVGEYTTPSQHNFDPAIHLLRRDISVALAADGSPSYLDILIKASKTDGLRRSVTKRIWASSDHITCPVTAMYIYLRKTETYSMNDPLFKIIIKKESRYLTRDQVNGIIKRTSKVAGIPMDMSSHSCRVGGATALAAAGFTAEQIRLLGRWVSDCYQVYTRMVAPFAKAASLAFGKSATSTMDAQVTIKALKVVNQLRDNPIAAITMKSNLQGEESE